MAVRIKRATAIGAGGNTAIWESAVANGNLRLKWGGTTWVYPSFVRIKSPTTGQWVNTGYQGYPNPPQSIWVHAWDFNNVVLAFTAPAAGGAPVASYDVRRTWSDLSNETIVTGVTGSPWWQFAVSQDGMYQFFVRARSAGGLVSAWTGPVKVRIGHTETGYYANENRTRAWSSSADSGYRYRDQWFNIAIGGDSSCVIQSTYIRNMGTPGYGYVSPGSNAWGPRYMYWLVNGGLYNLMESLWGSIPTGFSVDWHGHNQQVLGSNGWYASGSGWTPASGGDIAYTVYADAIWSTGYQNYTVSVYYVTRAYAGNSYW